MANRAYVSAWAKNYDETTKLERFEKLLESGPFSGGADGGSGSSFTNLIVRALDISETPLREWDLRGQNMTAHDVIELAGEHRGADMAYELSATWDLWTYDLGENRWSRKPQALEIICYGEKFDGGIAAEEGHFVINAGFEHFFTGHSGILGTHASTVSSPQAGGGGTAASARMEPEEIAFLEVMRDPARLREYHERTRANIQALLHWMREAEKQVPLDRVRLWSEGEEDLEARLDEILAVR